MSQTTRDVPKYVTVCDICDEILPKGDPGEIGSLTYGFIAHPVTQKTKWAYLIWPPANRERRMDWRERQKPENESRKYDFHADCILRVIEEAIAARTAEPDEEEVD